MPFFRRHQVWSFALRNAGVAGPIDLFGPAPLSAFQRGRQRQRQGRRRHLWPVWHRLIRERRPPVVFGEQVEAAIGHAGSMLYRMTWKESVTPSGRSVSPAASVGAPHIKAGSGSWPTPTTRDHKDGAQCNNVPINALLAG